MADRSPNEPDIPDAAACDDRLRRGESIDESFANRHAELAATMQFLHAAFAPPDREWIAVPDMPEYIDRFRILRRLGVGGFGVVYLAHDPQLDRQVAVKIVRRDTTRADIAVRLRRERRLTAAMRHPGIVPVFEAGRDGPWLYIVSEYCPGPTLADWLRRRTLVESTDDEPHAVSGDVTTAIYERPAPVGDTDETGDRNSKEPASVRAPTGNEGRQPDERTLRGIARHVAPDVAAQIVRLLADAVGHAHDAGVLHRDIKPGNVLLYPVDTFCNALGFVPRLTDFGLARTIQFGSDVTQSGTFVGTLNYVSPEQARGASTDLTPASDIYSLGVVLYELLTGRIPFEDSTQIDVLRRICEIPPVRLRRLNGSVPRDLEAVCLRCLEKSPERRYATAAALRDDLDRYLRGDATTARSISIIERTVRWSRRFPAAAALALLSIVAVITVLVAAGLHFRQVEQYSLEVADGLRIANEEREAARQARATADRQRELARAAGYRSDMRLAFDLLGRGDLNAVAEIMSRHDVEHTVDLRGPEWFVIDAELRAKQREIGRHDGAVTECVLTFDAATAFSTGVDGTVRGWDVATGRLLRSFDPGVGELHALALSPDETTIAVGGKTWLEDVAQVVLLDATTGERKRQLQTHETTIESVAFSPDGIWLAAGSRYQPAQLTRLADGRTNVLPAERRNRVVSFSADSQLLAIVASESQVDLWQPGEPEPKRGNVLTTTDLGSSYIARFSPVRSQLAISYTNRRYVSVYDKVGTDWDLQARLTARSLNGARTDITCLGFSPTGRYFAAGDELGTIVFWDSPTQSRPKEQHLPVATVTPHSERVTSLAFVSDTTVVSSSEDGRIVSSSPLAGGATHIRWTGLKANCSALIGDELLLGCDDGTVRRFVIDVRIDGTQHSRDDATGIIDMGDVPEVMLTGSHRVRSLAVSPDRDLMAIGTLGGGVRIHRFSNGELLRTQTIDGVTAVGDMDIHKVKFSADGERFACIGENDVVTVHDSDSGRRRARLEPPPVFDVAFCDGNQSLACGCRSEHINVYDVQTGAVRRTLVAGNSTSIDVSQDGRWLASVNLNGMVKRFAAQGDTEARSVVGHSGTGESIVFSPDSRTIVSVCDWDTLQFLDAATGVLLGRFSLADQSVADDVQVHCRETVLAVTNCGDAPITELYYWVLAR